MILEADYSQLEFRVAGILSGDTQIIRDVHDGKDIHRQTASIVHEKSMDEVIKDERDGAKSHSFSPLYGGTGAIEPPHVRKYYEEFFNVYQGVGRWHRRLMDGVLQHGIVRIPSGREYYWPDAKRLRNGKITNATQVVNYPVQGFATGDIVPLACVRALREFRRRGLKSLLILTVHDSIVVDVYPGELDEVVKALIVAMDVHEEAKERWDFELTLPLDIEIEAGPSWMELDEINLDKFREAA
jgi:DNA polymerase-1